MKNRAAAGTQNKLSSNQAHGHTNSQLELGLGRVETWRAPRRANRMTMAAWWFKRMREVVDNAVDWTPAPPARPQQTWLPQTHRECSV